jgi:organic radical activating enzyme
MTTPTANPATDKQIAFLTKLISDKGLDIKIPEEMTTKDASALIDEALEAPRKKKGVSLVKKAPVSLIKKTPVQVVAAPVVEPDPELVLVKEDAKQDAVAAVIVALEAAIAVLRNL